MLNVAAAEINAYHQPSSGPATTHGPLPNTAATARLRPAIQASVQSVLQATGVCVLFGATGVGKSVVARAVAASLPKAFHWAHFRDTDRDAALARLDTTLAWLASMNTAALIIEDLNVLEDAIIQVSLSQVVEAARRHDMRVLITCYSEPSPSSMDALGFGISAGIQCPHFTEKDTHSLVAEMGGDPAIWGRVAHVAGASGHPLLTHAFAAGLAARAWPQSEIPLILAQGLRTSDLDAAREAARANLISSRSTVPVEHLDRVLQAPARARHRLHGSTDSSSRRVLRPAVRTVDRNPWKQSVSAVAACPRFRPSYAAVGRPAPPTQRYRQ